MDNSIVIALATILLIHFIFSHYIDATKDINELYLNEQSTMETTRLNNESCIYKSSKLDYGGGLRVGLDIRYDHYKLRNGNFCDIWEIAMKKWNGNKDKSINLNGLKINIGVLNYNIHNITEYLNTHQITKVVMKLDRFLDSLESLTIILACLINGTLINFYHNVELELTDKDIEFDKIPFHWHDQGLATFENEYNYEKDKGVRVRISEKINNKIISHTDYVAINFISSVASTLKHLPIGHGLNANDKFVIVNDLPITNVLSKLLVGLVSNTELIISPKLKSLHQLLELNPTVLFMNSIDNNEITNIKNKLNPLDNVKYYILNYFLSKGKFSKLNNSKLRLLYIAKPIDKSLNLSSLQLNQLRSLLNARVIVENTYKSTIGPLILNDFYDYRIFPPSLENNLTSNGCICQCNEIKLTNVDEGKFGDIMVRGYNIGKVNNYLIGKGYTETKANKDNEGFITLNNVKGKWGSDGCLYVYNM